MYKNLIIKLDAWWCVNTQIAACLFDNITSDKNDLRLSKLRCFTILCTFCEILGYFFLTLGFFSSQPYWILITGLCFKVFGGILSSYFQNRSGVILSLQLQSTLRYLRSHGQEIRSLLVNSGCTEAEINSISTLPSEAYQTELSSYRRSFCINLGAPLACSVALLFNQDYITALIVMFLGLSAFPLGELFFKQHAFRNESELRLGKSAHLIEFIKKAYNDHVFLTLQVNLLSQLPLLFFVMRFMWSDTGNLLASFFALSQGLIGLTGTLSFQRSRVTSQRTVATAKHLIEAISSPAFIITESRWIEHTQHKNTLKPDFFQTKEIENGVIFSQFSTNLPGNSSSSKTLKPFTCIIPGGAVGILQAPSGQGKSTFLLSLMHILEHSGDLYFINDNTRINVHALTRDTFEKMIFFFREEEVEKSARLIDLFKRILEEDLDDIKREMKRLYGDMLSNLVFEAADNLIEQEINSIKQGKQTVFPKQMLENLQQLRYNRSALLQNILTNASGNLSTPQIYPERLFATLSSGEKRRLVSLLAFESAKRNSCIRLLILDEPLTHLDASSVNNQLYILKKIQKLPSPPSVLLISHQFVEDILATLQPSLLIHHNGDG